MLADKAPDALATRLAGARRDMGAGAGAALGERPCREEMEGVWEVML